MADQQVQTNVRFSRGGVLLRLAAVLPPLLTAVAFAIAWLQWGSDYSVVMAKTIQLEFLVIHSGLFLGVFILVPIETRMFRVLRWVAVALMAYLYLRGGHALLGWHGVLTIVGIFVGTYGGLLTAPALFTAAAASRGRRIIELAVRWFASMLTYGLVSSALDLPGLVNEWTVLRASVALGAIYFGVLALFEATPLYPRIRGAADTKTGVRRPVSE